MDPVRIWHPDVPATRTAPLAVTPRQADAFASVGWQRWTPKTATSKPTPNKETKK